MWTVREAGRRHELGRFLAQKPGQKVHQPPQHVSTTGQSSWPDRVEERPFRDVNIYEIMESVIRDYA